MPLEALQAIAGGGALLITLIGAWALGTGRVRVGWLVDRQEALLMKELEQWKSLAQGATAELKRLNDLLETAVKLLLERRNDQ